MRGKYLTRTVVIASICTALGAAGGIAGGFAATGDSTDGSSGDAALAKVSDGTIERVETDADHGSPYEAHVRRSDGTELEVLVNKDFEVTAVNEMPQMPQF